MNTGGDHVSETRKRIITSAVIVSAVILILLGVLSLITRSFVVYAILHIFLRLLGVPIVIKILQKFFKDQLTDSMSKALVLCGCIIVLDIVIVDAIRYILSHGSSTALFLPICLPICFMIIMFYSSKDTGGDKRDEKKLTYVVGIRFCCYHCILKYCLLYKFNHHFLYRETRGF